MIRFAHTNDLEQIIYLWKTAFPSDCNDFIQFYFSKKYKKEQTLVQVIDNKIVAMLEMIPYTMTFFGEQIKVSYISGANTLPQYQGNGLMKQLLEYSFVIANKAGFSCSVLIPQNKSLVNYYSKFGYKQLFEYQYDEINIEPQSFFIQEIDKKNEKQVYQFFQYHSLKRDFCIQKTFEDFQILTQDHYLSKGKVFFIEQNNNIVALAFCLFEKEKIIVKELLAEEDMHQTHLLKGISNVYNINSFQIVKRVPFNEKGIPLGMLKILNYKNLISIYQKYNQKQNFAHFQNINNSNNKNFDEKKYLDFESHSQLCDFLFKSQTYKPFMNLMLD